MNTATEMIYNQGLTLLAEIEKRERDLERKRMQWRTETRLVHTHTDGCVSTESYRVRR